MLPSLQAIIFDFDYTLADSSDAVIDCTKAALHGMGLPPATPEAIRRTIGLSLPETLVQLAGEEYRDRAEEFRGFFRERSDQIMVDWTQVYPGVASTVSALSSRGLQLGIVSTKFRFRIEAVLKREGLIDAFDVVVGGDDVDAFKPDPKGLLQAIKRLRSTPGQTIYAGDSLTDAETAHRARVSFLAVLSGVTRQEEFCRYEPIAVIDCVEKIPPLFGEPTLTSKGDSPLSF